MVRPHSGNPYKRKPPETSTFRGRWAASMRPVLCVALVSACGVIGTDPAPNAVSSDHRTGASGTGGPALASGSSGGSSGATTGYAGSGGALVGGSAMGSAGATGSGASTGGGGASGHAGTGGMNGSDAAVIGSDAGPPPATSAGCGTHPQRVFTGTFDDVNWLAAWDPRARVIFGATNIERVSDAKFGTALRVHFPAGS